MKTSDVILDRINLSIQQEVERQKAVIFKGEVLTSPWIFLVFPSGAGPTVLGTQPQQLPLGSLHISPVQTAFEPSSVPYYLQQDLEALQRVSQQYASPSLSQQSSPSPVNGQQSLLTTTAGGVRAKRNGRGSRRLSLDPHTKLRVERLEVVSPHLPFVFLSLF